mmetsp:Transcript_60441/g.162152  ORF Transcript_60441/g.162152 Transcript_60441/m.162152 type:complete len:382 (-) Transcript_60441:115-1260(-)
MRGGKTFPFYFFAGGCRGMRLLHLLLLTAWGLVENLDKAVRSKNPGVYADWVALKGKWQRPEDALPPSPRRKVAFLLMGRSGLLFESAWRAFFQAGDPALFTVHMHLTERHTTPKGADFGFWEKHMVDRQNTSWCKLEPARFELAARALEDANVSHLVWLSGDSVPVKTLEQVHASVTATDASTFCRDQRHPQRMRAEMWAIWSRPHAGLLVRNQDKLYRLFDGVSGACYDEDFYVNQLSVLGEQASMRQACPMWTHWIEKHGYPRDAPAPTLLSDSCSTKNPSQNMHPAMFYTVCPAGIMELVESPAVLFARKFFRDAKIDHGTTDWTDSHGNQRYEPLASFISHTLALVPEDPERGVRPPKARQRLLRPKTVADLRHEI